MKIYAIGDLHLSFGVDKPMDIFGEAWKNHVQAIQRNWLNKIKEEDLVILCGDLSWGMRLDEAKIDLEFIANLPGKKVCIKGNHDYWWEKIGRLNQLDKRLYFLQNTAYLVEKGVAICGTRAWSQQEDMTKEDEKVYKREVERLKLSLEDAKKKGAKEIIVALHYPPTNEKREPSAFTKLLENYPVSQVVFGHLHDEGAWSKALQGEYKGINYHLVAADYLNFEPKYIGEM